MRLSRQRTGGTDGEPYRPPFPADPGPDQCAGPGAARHDRLAEATRRAVRGWGLEILAADPAEYSSSLTAVLVPQGRDADAVRRAALERFELSLGSGLGKLAGRVFRIGHPGWFSELMLMGTLAGVEISLALAGVPHRKGGVDAAMDYLAGNRR
jgi:alanine-glyoxylate transaminase / serine-glyoxylate transaminase / serine-pyruvate transaminase